MELEFVQARRKDLVGRLDLTWVDESFAVKTHLRPLHANRLEP